MGDMGLAGAYGAQGAADALRQLIKDKLQRDQQQFENTRQTTNDTMNAELHAEQMRSLQENRASTQQAALEGEAAKGAAGLSIDQSIPAPMAGRLRGTMQAANMRDNPPLAQPPNMPDMMQPDIVPGMQPGAVWTGTDKQRTDEEQKQIRGRLLSDPNLGPREKLAIEMENAGMKVPAGVFGPKPPTHVVQAMKDGKPTYVNEGDAVGMTPYEKPQHDPTNSFQLQPELDATGKQTGRFLGYNTKTNSWEPVKGDGPKLTKAAPGAAQDARQSKMAEYAGQDVDEALAQVANAEQAGVLGPAAGRLYGQFLGGVVGSTGDPATDAKLGALKGAIDNLKLSYPGAITGGARGAASLMKRLDTTLNSDKMSPELLRGVLQEFKKSTTTRSGGGSAPSGAIVVTAPDGSRHPFDTQAQADAFKQLAGIQ